MAYAVIVDQADPWVDREKVRAEVDRLLDFDGTGPGAEAAERAALMLAGVMVE